MKAKEKVNYDELRKKYIESHATSCPFCGSVNIEAGYFDPTSDMAWCAVRCDHCGEEWDEEYHLVNVTFQSEEQ